MCQIAALLPPKYRGVYADHARLKEILAEQRQEPGGPPAARRKPSSPDAAVHSASA
jgi:hypothetical protein